MQENKNLENNIELEYMIILKEDYEKKQGTRNAIENNPEIEILRRYDIIDMYHIKIKTDKISEGIDMKKYVENKAQEIKDIEGVDKVNKVQRDYKVLEDYINQDQQPY
ncbi:MAG: hypothetical protein PHV16_02240 [Candidatus Nanoarchaeia archaeon]|nr:hypothetical protein [Candidatus Nanoarchaeia archaeon]